jgi:hypothetical protein
MDILNLYHTKSLVLTEMKDSCSNEIGWIKIYWSLLILAQALYLLCRRGISTILFQS